MKILVLANITYPMSRDHIFSGIESFVVNCHDVLKHKTEHEIWIACTTDSSFDQEGDNVISYSGESWYKYVSERQAQGLKALAHGWKCAASNIDFIKKVKEHDFDLIISSVVTVSSVKIMLKNCKVPYVLFVHSDERVSTDSWYTSTLKLKKEYPHFRVAAPSAFTMNSINRVHPGLVDFYVHLSYAEPKLFVPEHKDYVVYTGRIAGDKCLDIILHGFKGSGTKLVLIGKTSFGDPIEKTVAKYVEEYPDEIIHSNEVVPQPVLFQVVAKAKALLIPSQREAYCLSAFEAQKMGVPVIFSASYEPCGIDEYLVEGETGFAIPAYKKRYTTIGNEFRIASLKAGSLDRKAIWKRFKQYSAKKFAEDLITKCVSSI